MWNVLFFLFFWSVPRLFIIFAHGSFPNCICTMIKFALILLVLLLDYLGYRYGKSRLCKRKQALLIRRKSIHTAWAKKKKQLQEKTKQLEKEIKEEEEEWDDLLDKETTNFLLLGAVATLLFLLVGLFTGNPLYFYLTVFLITTLVYVYYSKLQ